MHRDFSGGREELSPDLSDGCPPVSDPTAAPQKILEQLGTTRSATVQAELDSRQCLSGPHKDDLLVELDGRSAKTYGSQGGRPGRRPCPSSWHSGTSSSRRPGEYPVLLLDDVLSELDARRQAFVPQPHPGGTDLHHLL